MAAFSLGKFRDFGGETEATHAIDASVVQDCDLAAHGGGVDGFVRSKQREDDAVDACGREGRGHRVPHVLNAWDWSFTVARTVAAANGGRLEDLKRSKHGRPTCSRAPFRHSKSA